MGRIRKNTSLGECEDGQHWKKPHQHLSIRERKIKTTISISQWLRTAYIKISRNVLKEPLYTVFQERRVVLKFQKIEYSIHQETEDRADAMMSWVRSLGFPLSTTETLKRNKCPQTKTNIQ